jgi:hypothetical protein
VTVLEFIVQQNRATMGFVQHKGAFCPVTRSTLDRLQYNHVNLDGVVHSGPLYWSESSVVSSSFPFILISLEEIQRTARRNKNFTKNHG